MEKQTLEQQVLDIIRNESGYFIEIDYCHPERLTDRDAAQETRAQKFERLEKLETCIRSLYMDIPCQPTPEFIAYIKQFVK